MVGKIFRWILFIPLIVIVFYLIEIGFDWLIYKAITLSTFWLILIVIFFSGAILGLFSVLVSILTTSIFLLAPSKRIAGMIFGVLALMVGIVEFILYLKLDITTLAKVIILIQVLWFWGVLAFLGFNIEEGIK